MAGMNGRRLNVGVHTLTNGVCIVWIGLDWFELVWIGLDWFVVISG